MATTTVTAGGRSLPLYVATPDGDGPFPGVVVIRDFEHDPDAMADARQRIIRFFGRHLRGEASGS